MKITRRDTFRAPTNFREMCEALGLRFWDGWEEHKQRNKALYKLPPSNQIIVVKNGQASCAPAAFAFS